MSITGTLAAQVVLSANQNHIGQATPIFVGAGTIRVTTGASSTGAIQWYCKYESLAPGSYVVAA